MQFELVGDVNEREVIAEGRAVRVRVGLSAQYGRARWRKMKGVALVRLARGETRRAELHWYEAHGIGRVRMKIKQLLD